MNKAEGTPTPSEMTMYRVNGYRAAAEGQFDIHTYSYNGEVQRECLSLPGEPVDKEIHGSMLTGFDSEGNTVQLTYDGAMSAESLTALADSLEAQLDQAS